MRVVLEVVGGPQKGRSYVFEAHGPTQYIVGRSRLVDCPVDEDTALSREHFVVEVAPPGCVLRDLQSTNGTFVNQQRVERATLSPGDRIVAGQSTFEVNWQDPRSGNSNTFADVPPTAEFIQPSRLSISCSSCGAPAPPGLDIAGVNAKSFDTPIEAISWLCDHCRHETRLTPQPVPGYNSIRELGRGAMGVVYLARHNRTGRLVALKLIVPESAAARSAIDRFLREMKVISQLKHPNIVEWLEQGVAGGRFWFAMEYVEGTNLEAVAQANPGRYPIQQACRMAAQILKGLEFAHERGFVHRDIKPDNILIGKDENGHLVAKISDFGLAKNFRELGLSGLTFSGEMRGTIPFMPPEQMLDFRAVTPAADVFATVATLYYLMTAQFIYDTSGEAGGDMVHLVLEHNPVPIRRRRPEVPAELETVIAKGLAREPVDRYASARELRNALRPFC